MHKVALLLALFGLTMAVQPRVFRNQFLQSKTQQEAEEDAQESNDEILGITPPAGHGLPEFSDSIENLSADQLEKEINDWKLAEQAAEDEFYAQTDAAIAEAEKDKEECQSIEDETERKECEDEAQGEIDSINKMIDDLMSSHAAEEELFDGVFEQIIQDKRDEEAAAEGDMEMTEGDMETMEGDMEGDMGTMEGDMEGDMETMEGDMEGDMETMEGDGTEQTESQ